MAQDFKPNQKPHGRDVQLDKFILERKTCFDVIIIIIIVYAHGRRLCSNWF